MFIWTELDEINLEVGYVMGLKMTVMWILPKLMEYEKSHKRPKDVVRINYINEFTRDFHMVV